MLDIIIFLLLFFIFIPVGRKLSGLFIDNNRLNFLERSFIWWGLGTGGISLFILFIGMAGLLYRWVIITALVAIALIFIKDIIRYIKESISWFLGLARLHLSGFERLLISLLIFSWFFTLIGSLSPILGNDALSYHMRDPKLFVQAHKIMHIPYTRDSLWPFLIQMLFTLGLLLKGAILSKLFHFCFGVFSIIGVYILSRRYLQRQISLLAAAIFAVVPAVFTVTTYAYTDLARVFYTILAFYAFFMWLDAKKEGWFYLSGVSCGFLLGIKITTADIPAIIMFLYFFAAVSQRINPGKVIVTFLTWCALIFIVCGVWYIRSWIILGNPIFPFASSIFGYGYPQDMVNYSTVAGIGMGVVQYFKIPWLLTMRPDTFGGESIGAVFLIFLPFLVFIRNKPRFIKYVIFVSVYLYTSWFIIFQYARFFLPALPFLSILVSYVYFEFCKKDKIISFFSTTTIIGLFLYGATISVYHNLGKIPVAFGFESRGDYLLRRERTYGMADYINKNLPKKSKVLVMAEPRLFYFDRSVALDVNVKIDLDYNKNIKQKTSLDEYLHSQGFGYLLYTKTNSTDPRLKPVFGLNDLFVKDDKLFVTKTEFNYKDENYEYQLYKITKKGSRGL